MNTNLKVGDKVRLTAAEHRRVGTVISVSDGMVAVRYEHTADKFTNGYYPVGHVEKVISEPVISEAVAAVKPRATTAQIIGGAK